MACNEVSWKVATKTAKRGEGDNTNSHRCEEITVTWNDVA